MSSQSDVAIGAVVGSGCSIGAGVRVRRALNNREAVYRNGPSDEQETRLAEHLLEVRYRYLHCLLK